MKADTETVTVRVPKSVVANLEREARARGISKSEVVRERLAGPGSNTKADPLANIRDLIGYIDDPNRPTDVSARKKHYLKAWGFGRKRRR